MSPGQALALLRSAGAMKLTPAERIDLAMILRGIEREVALARVRLPGTADGPSLYVLSHRHGTHLRLNATSGAEAVTSLDAETERFTRAAAAGIVPPAFAVEAVLASLTARFSEVTDPSLRQAIDRQRRSLEAAPRRPDGEPGLGSLPGGSAYYARRIALLSGTGWSPDQIETAALAEVGRLTQLALPLLDAQGFRTGSIGARLRGLAGLREHLYPDSDTGREQAIAAMNWALERARPVLAELFTVTVGARVERMSSSEEAASTRGYRRAAAPGVQPAYLPDLSDIRARPAWTLATVGFHETLPGHLLQAAVERARPPHPLKVRHAPGWSEGWPIHAEAIVDRLGLFTPVERIGFIQSRLFRMARVVADIGIHRRGWDRARARRYLDDTVGFPLFFAFDVEADRYCVEPAAFAGDAMVALALARAKAQPAALVANGPRAADAILAAHP